MFPEQAYYNILTKCSIGELPDKGIDHCDRGNYRRLLAMASKTDKINFGFRQDQGSINYVDLIYKQTSPVGTAYVFPWHPNINKIPGYCIDEESNTNIILTGGMNGCSLKIAKISVNHSNFYVFIHDANNQQYEGTRNQLLDDIRISMRNIGNVNTFSLIETITDEEYASKLPQDLNDIYYRFIPLIIPIGSTKTLKVFFSCITQPNLDRNDLLYNREYSYLTQLNLP